MGCPNGVRGLTYLKSNSGLVRLGQVNSGQVKSRQVKKSRQNMSGSDKFGLGHCY